LECVEPATNIGSELLLVSKPNAPLLTSAPKESNAMLGIPPVTQALIIANVAAFLLEMVGGSGLVTRFALWPLGSLFLPWQPLTYAFLHGSFAHLFFNMLGLYMFGADLERVWGPRRYLVYYGVSVLSAAIMQLAFAALSASNVPAIGASGGVFGLLL